MSTLTATHRYAASTPATNPLHRFAIGAVLSPIAFTLSWLVLGALSPGYDVFGTHIAPYSPITQPISGLGLGVTGPYMNAAFVLCGVVLLAGVAAATQTLLDKPGARWLSGVLLGLSPIGMIVAGVFNLESPMLHFSGALLAFGIPVVGFAVAGWQLRRVPERRVLGTWLLLAAPLTLALVVAYFASFDQATTAAGHGVRSACI